MSLAVNSTVERFGKLRKRVSFSGEVAEKVGDSFAHPENTEKRETVSSLIRRNSISHETTTFLKNAARRLSVKLGVLAPNDSMISSVTDEVMDNLDDTTHGVRKLEKGRTFFKK